MRILAAFCGTYSLKPTHNRLSYRNVANTDPGQLDCLPSVEVMGTSIGSLKLVLSALLSTQPWLRDPAVVPMPWGLDIEKDILEPANDTGKTTDKTPLKLGILFNDGFMALHPPISRGIHMICNALTKASHKVVDWGPPSHQKAAHIHLLFFQSDRGFDFHKQLDLSGEPLIPPFREVFELNPPVSAVNPQGISIQGRDACEAYSDY